MIQFNLRSLNFSPIHKNEIGVKKYTRTICLDSNFILQKEKCLRSQDTGPDRIEL